LTTFFWFPLPSFFSNVAPCVTYKILHLPIFSTDTTFFLPCSRIPPFPCSLCPGPLCLVNDEASPQCPFFHFSRDLCSCPISFGGKRLDAYTLPQQPPGNGLPGGHLFFFSSSTSLRVSDLRSAMWILFFYPVTVASLAKLPGFPFPSDFFSFNQCAWTAFFYGESPFVGNCPSPLKPFSMKLLQSSRTFWPRRGSPPPQVDWEPCCFSVLNGQVGPPSP